MPFVACAMGICFICDSSSVVGFVDSPMQTDRASLAQIKILFRFVPVVLSFGPLHVGWLISTAIHQGLFVVDLVAVTLAFGRSCCRTRVFLFEMIYLHFVTRSLRVSFQRNPIVVARGVNVFVPGASAF